MENSRTLLKFEGTKPRIILMINGKVGYEISKYLVSQKERILAVFLPDHKLRRYEAEIVNLFHEKIIHSVDRLKNGRAAELFKNQNPDILIVSSWDYLLKKEIFNLPKYGAINLHSGYLPKNRGWYPNVWPFIDNSPAGVTIHQIDEGADTGPILTQERTIISPTDNAADLYDKQQNQIINLFKKTWVELKSEGIELIPQDHEKATYHHSNELNEGIEIDIEKNYKAKDLINLIRSRSFHEKGLVFYRENEKKVQVKIVLQEGKTT